MFILYHTFFKNSTNFFDLVYKFVIFFKILLTFMLISYYNKYCLNKNADMAELVDAQDLKSCGLILRPGSIPGICTKFYNKLSYCILSTIA